MTDVLARDLAAIDTMVRSGQAASADEDRSAPLELDLGKTTIVTVIWATGYRPDFTWVRLPFVDADGYPMRPANPPATIPASVRSMIGCWSGVVG
jgi:putative flavoprotein involved in K+ transport